MKPVFFFIFSMSLSLSLSVARSLSRRGLIKAIFGREREKKQPKLGKNISKTDTFP